MEFPLPLTGTLPSGWKEVERRLDGVMWTSKKMRLTVIASYNRETDGRMWMHLSMSHESRIPTYDELVYLKRHWAGDDRKAIMVLPEARNHVNIDWRVLHLFTCLEGDPLPEFSQGLGTL